MKICRKGLHQYNGRNCPECRKLYRAAWYKANPNKDLWAKTNQEKVKISKKMYASSNPEKIKASRSLWSKANPSNNNARRAKRRAAKISRTPKWLTVNHLFEIRDFYTQAKELNKIFFNRKFHVDHIIPLQGKNVSGLHVPWNLQLLTDIENSKKGNRL